VENVAWNSARDVALRHLPPPGDDAMTCGPGPFSMGAEETTRAMLAAAGFEQIDEFRRYDEDICVGRSVEEAIDYQVLVGPSGEIIREAGDLGQEKLPIIRDELATILKGYRRDNGEVWMPSSAWVVVASKPGD
jgi:hypothetical protein